MIYRLSQLRKAIIIAIALLTIVFVLRLISDWYRCKKDDSQDDTPGFFVRRSYYDSVNKGLGYYLTSYAFGKVTTLIFMVAYIIVFTAVLGIWLTIKTIPLLTFDTSDSIPFVSSSFVADPPKQMTAAPYTAALIALTFHRLVFTLWDGGKKCVSNRTG